jgi:hypothetical protein
MHVDAELCMEVIMLQGDVSEVKLVAEGLMALKGVQHLKRHRRQCGCDPGEAYHRDRDYAFGKHPYREPA